MKLKESIVFSATTRIAVVLICGLLVFARYSIGFKINDGLPPLVKATSEADKTKVESLLKAGYFVDQADEDFNVALHYATLLSDNLESLDVFKLLLKNYASTNQRNNKGIVPLHGVGEVDDLDERMYIVRSFILHGANIHARDNNGFGLLERLVELIDNIGLQMMLDYWGWLLSPADIEAARKRAEYYNNGFTVRTMEEYRAGDSLVANKNNFSDLVQAILSWDIVNTAKIAQSSPEMVNQVIPDWGFSPLHLAVVQPEEYALGLVTALLENGANIDMQDYRGATPLLMVMHNASNVQIKQLITLLVKHGANINTSDENKDTLVHLAVKKNNGSLLQFLLEKFPALRGEAKNVQGKTAKDLARELGYGALYKQLR